MADAVRPVHRESGFANTRRPRDHHHRGRRASGGRGGRETCQAPEFGPTIHEGADVGRELTGDDRRVVRAALCGVEVHAAGDVARLHDIARHLGAVNLAPYLTRTSAGVF